MKDHFGREINEGDLVVAMAISRYSPGMAHGLAVGNSSVRYSTGGTGSCSNQLRMDTENDPKMLKIQEDLVLQYAHEDALKENKQRATRKAKIKAKDFKRFCVYGNGAYDHEMFLGPIELEGVKIPSAWIQIYKDDYKQKISLSNCKFDLVFKEPCGYYRHYKAGDIKGGQVRDCKCPTKTKKIFEMPEDTFKSLIGTDKLVLI